MDCPKGEVLQLARRQTTACQKGCLWGTFLNFGIEAFQSCQRGG